MVKFYHTACIGVKILPRVDNSDFYIAAMKKYGISAKGLNWNSKKSQYIRFEALYSFLKKDIGKCTIVDAGCGFGDFYLFLKENKTLPKEYIGIDIVDEMVFEAKRRTNAKIYKKDLLTDSLITADYYVASGSLNILTRFETYLFIKRCFDSSKKGFLFNMLKGKDKSQSFNYFQPQEIKNYCRSFSKEVIIKKNYMENDFTVFLKKV